MLPRDYNDYIRLSEYKHRDLLQQVKKDRLIQEIDHNSKPIIPELIKSIRRTTASMFADLNLSKRETRILPGK